MTRSLTIQALFLGSLLTACVPATPDEASTAALASQAADKVDGGFAACASGDGGIVAPGACWTFTAAAAGASTAGDNATVDEYALEPAAGSTRQGKLVLLLNASQSQPSEFIADPNTNLYNTLAGEGFHVLGLAYRSSNMIAAMCKTSACFGPTRETIVTGAYVTGASSKVSDMREDEGIVQRLQAALQYLDAHQPTSGWAQFLTPGGTLPQSIIWNKIIASGHSQGGGHAAYIDKLYDVPRVVQLSSTCDNINGVPAEWTNASSTWVTSPNAMFVGFAASTGFNENGVAVSGDTTCPYHVAVWQNMALATVNMHDDAATCPGVTAHGATVACTANASEWANLYQ